MTLPVTALIIGTVATFLSLILSLRSLVATWRRKVIQEAESQKTLNGCVSAVQELKTIVGSLVERLDRAGISK